MDAPVLLLGGGEAFFQTCQAGFPFLGGLFPFADLAEQTNFLRFPLAPGLLRPGFGLGGLPEQAGLFLG